MSQPVQAHTSKGEIYRFYWCTDFEKFS